MPCFLTPPAADGGDCDHGAAAAEAETLDRLGVSQEATW